MKYHDRLAQPSKGLLFALLVTSWLYVALVLVQGAVPLP
jgi:hypothetical protein